MSSLCSSLDLLLIYNGFESAFCSRVASTDTPTAHNPNRVLREMGCPICLEDFTEDKTVVSTPCGHIFCDKCLSESTAPPAGTGAFHQAHCPSCRTKYNESMYSLVIYTSPKQLTHCIRGESPPSCSEDFSLVRAKD
ncbi:hypothetical protein BDQ12DRAFT_402053 [Crucibulum laeve]|uniref:RING-type domain-containing protein n=1 Tax=Crucibulum laeve TaxID=68775 RepID=A0A5C3LKS8_9AGAR|nr:hypothetical protein BDQ12DRAFT_402053 [Crucibulum laeve]